MSKFRVVAPDEATAPDTAFPAAARAALEAVLAKGAVAMTIIFEIPGSFGSVTVLPLDALERGLIEVMRDQYFNAGE